MKRWLKFILFLLPLAALSQSLVIQGPPKLPLNASGGSLPCTPSYSNLGGQGDRTLSGPNGQVWSVTDAGVAPNMEGAGGSADSHWVDGNFAAGQGFYNGGTVDSNSWTQFDTTNGVPVLVIQATMMQSDTNTQGVPAGSSCARMSSAR